MATNYYQQWAPQSYQNTTYQPVYQAEPVQSAPAKWGPTPTERFIPEADQHPKPKQTWFQAHFGGLKRTLRLFLAVAIIVLVVNVSWLLYAKTHYGGISSGLGIIQRGDCDVAKSTNTWLHLLINVLSTSLLTGSNAFMSAYCSPSRKEIDKAHAKRKWLHVGILSLRNLGKIAKRKSLVVLLLCVSSVPFHLLYNSLVFVSLSANNYYYTIGTPDFLEGASYNLTGPLQNSGGRPHWMLPALPGETSYVPFSDTATIDNLYEYYDQIQKNASSWERLSNRDCIEAYSNVFMTARRNLVLVSKEKNTTNSVLDYGISELDDGGMDNNWWICSRVQDGGNVKCQPDDFKANADNWTVWGYPIDYCLSERTEDVCEVEFSVDIMLVVIVFNVIKVIAMTWVLLRYNAENILTTVGDSVSSFFKREDETTRGMCLTGWRDVGHTWRYPGNGVLYQPRRQRWAKSVSTPKWTLFILMMLACFAIIAFFGGWGFVHTKSRGNSLSLSSLWRLGFGRAHQDAIVLYDAVTSLVGVALLANIPQILLASVWLLYMGIMTSMFLAADWATFGTKGQPLMVNNAHGKQRGTWLLGAPLVWGLPLLILQVILHWLISQSIFLISLNIHDPDGTLTQHRRAGPRFLNCGYSPIAIIFCIVASVLLMLSAIALAFRRFPQGAPPVVATCSAAISAACHLPYGMLKHDSLYGNMRWGQCGQPQYGVGHCAMMPEDAFKNGHAQAPVPGWAYT
ncbi:hypothetical protein P171DRAFT_409004 [Karstenula rhodostoma CBS 690.94]|uniref:DUF6536 domain-containing protein n=1 Tax=Karstenula rhodostoma CBS 690.94 TaxID=1392251 RepID=A0A9P4PKM2_9PLEO|nr:hypothetical protein P171DRAFT_409004 [Karstenula rhodostoma CBS 690.94]